MTAGMIVIATAGHDMGRMYLVVKDEDKYALVCDGKRHRLDNPKRKNKKHLHHIFESVCFNPNEITDGVLRKKLSALNEEYERIIN